MDDKARKPHQGCVHKMLAIAADIVICTMCRHGVHRRRRPWVSELGFGPWVSERMAGAMDQQDFPQGFGGGFCFPIFWGDAPPFRAHQRFTGKLQLHIPWVRFMGRHLCGWAFQTKKQLSSGDQTRQSTTCLDIWMISHQHSEKIGEFHCHL